jgi:hypothetical protein
MPRAYTVEDLLKKRRGAKRELNSVVREFGEVGGFALHHGKKVAQKSIEDIDIRLARLGYNPEGTPLSEFSDNS